MGCLPAAAQSGAEPTASEQDFFKNDRRNRRIRLGLLFFYYYFFMQALSLIVFLGFFFQGTRERSAEPQERQAAQGQAQETRGKSWRWWKPTAETALARL